MADRIASSLGQIAFAVPETTAGVLAFPSAADQKLRIAGEASINQQPAFSDSEESDNTLDILERFQDQTGPGEFSLPTYVRPSGTAGTPPHARYLLESLMGVETINGGTSVVYSQSLTKPSVSLWVLKDHTLFFARGATVDAGAGKATNTGGTMLTFTGGFMEMGWVGTDELNGDVTASAELIIKGSAKRFTAGGRVKLGADDNTGAGYEIDSVTVGTSTVTLTEAVTATDGTVVEPFLPTYTAVGTPLENKKTSVKFDDTAMDIKSMDFSIGAPVQYQTEEITTSGFPEAYIPDRRAINGSIEKLFRQSQVKDFYDGYQGQKVDIDIIVGDTAGSIFTTSFPYAQLEVPATTTTAPTVSMTTTFTALGNAGEDSATITFT